MKVPDGNDSTGPSGAYTYAVRFCAGADVNPYRLAIEGSWAAAGRGADVLLNGASLGAAAAGPGALTPFPARMGLGLIVPLVLEFVGRGPKALAALSAVLVLLGGFLLRYVVMMSIQS